MNSTSALYLNAIAVAGAALLPVPALAGSAAPAFLPIGEMADAPAGFAEMCERDAFLCDLGRDDSLADAAGIRFARAEGGVGGDPSLSPTGAIRPANGRADRGEAAAPEADQAPIIVMAPPARDGEPSRKQLFKMLKQVNARVNREIYPMVDERIYGVGEYWQRPDQSRPMGDCEDYAIEKRVRLMDQGFPASRLFYAVVYHPIKGLHTVLVARLPDGDFLLDNMTPHIVRWSQARFSWLRQQLPGQPDRWARIGDKRPDASYARADNAAGGGAG